MKKVIFVIIISSIFLSSCNTIRSSAGVERKVIDEYNVVENPPLVIPPNFNLLPPDQIESKDIVNCMEENFFFSMSRASLYQIFDFT